MDKPYTERERQAFRDWANMVFEGVEFTQDEKEGRRLLANARDFLRWKATCQALEAEIAELKAQLKERDDDVIESPKSEPDYDALSATAIVGWHLCHLDLPHSGDHLFWHDKDGNPGYEESEWHPMTDIAQADMVRKAMEAEEWRFDIYTNSPWGQQVIVWKKDAPTGEIREAELSAAFVKASLRAVGAIE